MKSLREIFPRGSQSFMEANPPLPTVLNTKSSTAVNLAPAKSKRGLMNKTEMIFELLLKARFSDCVIRFEAYKLKIGDRCHYCPDFAVIHLSGLIDFFECKGGHIWEDSKIKFKAAKEMYPHHHFEMWQCKKGLWERRL